MSSRCPFNRRWSVLIGSIGVGLSVEGGGGGGREEDNGNIDGINGTEEGRQRMDERFVMNVSKDALGVSMRQSMLMRQEEEEVEAEEVDRGGGGGSGTKRRWWW